MGFVVAGPNSKVLIADVNLSQYFNRASFPGEVTTADITGFGKSHHCYIPTLRDGSLSLGGFWDGAVDAVDEELAVSMGSTPSVMTIGLAGLAIGDRLRMMSGLKTSYEISPEVDGVVAISANAQASSGGVESGVSLHDLGAETGTGATASVDNGAGTTNGGVAHLHITAVSGTPTTLGVHVQHSVDNSTWADLIDFTAATARTSERKEITGTVNRYLRARFAFGAAGASFTVAVAFARR